MKMRTPISLKLVLVLVLFLAVFEFELVTSVGGRRVFGTRFTMALPRVTAVPEDTDNIGVIYMMTEEERSQALLFFPHNSADDKTGYEMNTHYLKRYDQYAVPIRKQFLFPADSGSGVYNSVMLRSSSPIRVVLYRFDNKAKESAGSHNVMPEGSCAKNYYVSTGKGKGFMMVMTFDSAVNLLVTFADSIVPFNIPCGVNKTCSANSSVQLSLGKNKAWYLEQDSNVIGFQNTKIEALSPVFVVAGNKAFAKPDGKPLDDLIVTSIYPTHAWGNEYITIGNPLRRRSVLLQFNAPIIPFNFQIFDGVKLRKERIKDFSYPFTISKSTKFFIIRAEVPFGLYQMFDPRGTNYDNFDCMSSVVHLIPTVQWAHGVVVSELLARTQSYTHNLFTTAAKSRVVLTGHKANNIEWEKSLKYNTRTYNIGFLNVKKVPIKLFSNDPMARMIVYEFKKTIEGFASCSCIPLDFYQADIDSQKCELTVAVSDDGIDNDCDGLVDEEIKDRKDNDGDKEIDEDSNEIEATTRSSAWTKWAHVCDTQCGGEKTKRFVRSCRKTRFGKECRGDDVACVPEATCRKKCEGKDVPSLCKCQAGCLKCHRDSGHCDRCKDGYYDEQYCLRPCPKGWMGKGCSKAVLKYIKIDLPSKKRNTSFSFSEEEEEGTDWSGRRYRDRRNDTAETYTSAPQFKEDTKLGKWFVLLLFALLFLILTPFCFLTIKAYCKKRPVVVKQEVEVVDEVEYVDPTGETGGETETDIQSLADIESLADKESLAESTV